MLDLRKAGECHAKEQLADNLLDKEGIDTRYEPMPFSIINPTTSGSNVASS